MSRAVRGRASTREGGPAADDGGPPSHLLSRFQPSCWVGLKVVTRGGAQRATVLSTASGWVTLRLQGGSAGPSDDADTVRKRAYDLWCVGDVSSLPTRGGGEGSDSEGSSSEAAAGEAPPAPAARGGRGGGAAPAQPPPPPLPRRRSAGWVYETDTDSDDAPSRGGDDASASHNNGAGERAERQLIGEVVKIHEGAHAGAVGFVVARVSDGVFTVRVGEEEVVKGRGEFRKASSSAVIAALAAQTADSPTTAPRAARHMRSNLAAGGGGGGSAARPPPPPPTAAKVRAAAPAAAAPDASPPAPRAPAAEAAPAPPPRAPSSGAPPLSSRVRSLQASPPPEAPPPGEVVAAGSSARPARERRKVEQLNVASLSAPGLGYLSAAKAGGGGPSSARAPEEPEITPYTDPATGVHYGDVREHPWWTWLDQRVYLRRLGRDEKVQRGEVVGQGLGWFRVRRLNGPRRGELTHHTPKEVALDLGYKCVCVCV
jgi:hypothetical protein